MNRLNVLTSLSLHVLSLLPVMVLASCGTADAPHYYTLVAPVSSAASASATVSAEEPLSIELLPVEVPAQVDTEQMVVRENATDVVPVGSRRWVAPLHAELRTALSSAVSTELGARDVTGTGATGPGYRIKVVVRRFDSLLGANASIFAVWTVRATGAEDGGPPARALTCESRVTEKVPGGFDAMAAGHQRAILTISKQIAATIKAMRAHPDAAPTCSP